LTPYQPGTAPAWFPLGQEQIVVFDESSSAVVATDPGLTPFRFATGRVTITSDPQQKDGLVVPLDFPFGWLRLNLNTSTPGGVLNPVAQSFVAAVFSADATEARLSAGVESFALDSACAPDLEPFEPIALPARPKTD
jgi:hypothetical protein